MPTPKLNASSRIMLEEAEKRGISCVAFEDNETVLMSTETHQWYIRGSRTSFQSSVGKTIADYKPLTKQVLSHFQLPTGKWVVISQKTGLDQETLQQIAQLEFPVVVKPLDERHGKGVIVGIENSAVLTQIYQPGTALLVEEQLRCQEYRIVCLDYQFTAAAYRKSAHVMGDGQHTVEELITEKNKHPWRGAGHQNNLTVITVDELVISLLSEQKLKLNDIPQPGQEVVLRKTANLSTGGEAWNITETVHPENRKLFEQIARACDLNIIGIDVMCTDISSPILDQPKAGIIEVNASPGLRMHHYPLQGEPINIAGQILDLCLRSLKQ